MVECHLHINKFHIKAMLCYFFFAYGKSLFFLGSVCFALFFVLFCANSHYFFKRLKNFFVPYHCVAFYNTAVFYASCRFNNSLHSFFYFHSVRVKVIHFACLFKSYSNYFSHFFLLAKNICQFLCQIFSDTYFIMVLCLCILHGFVVYLHHKNFTGKIKRRI